MRAKHSRFLLAAFAAFLAATGSLKAQAPGPATQDEIATAPVVVDGVALFGVRGVTSFPAATRAAFIRDRLLAVADDPSVAVDAIRAVDGDGGTRIMGGDAPIMTVLDVDASLEQVPRIDLAGAIVARIRQAVADYRQERSPSALRRDALHALGATVVLVLSLVLVHWFWRWLDRLVVSRLRTRIHTVGIQSFELMRAEHIWSAVRGSFLAIRALVYLLIGLSYLGYVLAVFPWTRSTTSNVLDFALGPLTVIGGGIVANIPSLVFLAVLFVMVRLLLRLISVFFYGVGQGSVKLEGFDPDWAKPTYNLVTHGGDRVCCYRGLSLHSRIAVRRVQGRVAVHRRRVFAWIVVCDFQPHCRLHDYLPAGFQGG